MLRSIIVDDEVRSVKALEWQLQHYCPDVEVVVSWNSSKDAIASIKSIKPDMLFLDIEMPHLNGFDVLEKLQPVDFAVIFTTAYDKFAIKAYRYSAIDYLLKPIDKDDLIEAVEKVKKYHGQSQQARIELLLDQLKLLKNGENIRKVALTTLDSYLFVDTSDILYCESDRNYTRVFLKDGKSVMVAKTLKLVEDLIASDNFFRAHHSFLINVNCIKEFKKEDGYIIMANNNKIPLSRSKRDEFFNFFSRL